MKELLERYSAEISGIISCIDRMILQGRMPVFSYAKGMAGYLSKRGIKIFDFLKFAAPITEDVKDHAEQVAKAANLKIDYIAKKNFRKEDKIAKVIGERGEHAGLVWIFSAIEPCTTYAPRYSEKRKGVFEHQ